MNRLIICYKRYESMFEEDDIEHNEWRYYLGTLEQFELENPSYRIMFCYMPEDNLLR